MPEFDAYLMVDWSANGTPKTGKDSIWYCVVSCVHRDAQETTLSNPPTRHQAVNEIASLLVSLVSQNRSVLVGFDFPFGYPAGFAARLGLDTAHPWRDIWGELSRLVVDRENNSSNRFEVAAELNRRLSGEPFPFWGIPPSRSIPYLTPGKSQPHSSHDLAEYRATERCVSGPQPVWKLFYPGSVGSQALLGIPWVWQLRNHPSLSRVTRIWPFETGLQTLPPRDEWEWLVLLAEIYPSLVSKGDDAAQVRALAGHFGMLDGTGQLSSLFAGPSMLPQSARTQVESEEAWILGV